MRKIYHVSKKGNDMAEGTEAHPFLTISKAADIAEAGDTVIVHEGVYRESVSPKNSGRDQYERITYMAAPGEKAVIKGSEKTEGWEEWEGIHKADIPADVFGKFNPFAEVIDGDWLVDPIDPLLHAGAVYLCGKMLKEVPSKEAAKDTPMSWYAEVFEDRTEVYANFGGEYKKGEVEINVRKTCFFPEHMGLNYITVRGFEMAQAATLWSPPTAEQTGMLGVNWSKGWIIEDNILHDSRCSAICVGKERSTGHNFYSRYHDKPGYQYQLETAFAAYRSGWDKETIGGHIIRNNTIYDCGQNGIVGNLGGAFSEIYSNHIYNIGNKKEYFGWEIAGIKLHAAIDTQIHDNHIHDCLYGTWLDWQAQGARISRSVYYNNEIDLFIEVTHGPHLIDNNILLSKMSLQNAAQGGAYVDNLFGGCINHYDVRDRSTPYHLPHSTILKGTAVVYGADDRFFGNIFIGKPGEGNEYIHYGTDFYTGCPVDIDEYIKRVLEQGRGDIEKFLDVRQPAYINQNLYLKGAVPFDKEKENAVSEKDPSARMVKKNDGVYLEIDIPEEIENVRAGICCGKDLPAPRISCGAYECPDGSPLVIDVDLLGKKRSEKSAPGPFDRLKPGKNSIKVF